jgi:hypothetical protein
MTGKTANKEKAESWKNGTLDTNQIKTLVI